MSKTTTKKPDHDVTNSEESNAAGVAGAVKPSGRSVQGELIPGISGKGVLVDLAAELGDGATQIANNFPQDPGKRLILTSRVKSGDSKPLSDIIGQEIGIKYWCVHNVELLNEKNGEINTCPRVVLIDHDDNTYQAVSFGIFDGIKMIVDAFGDAELPKSLRVKINQKSTGRKNRILLLEIVAA